MQFYSTNNHEYKVSFKEAIFKGLPDDKGLFMPECIPVLPANFLERLNQYSFPEIALALSKNLLGDAIPESELEIIIERSMDFPLPLHALREDLFVLELFHGPTLAFKDFGARFMAQTMRYFSRHSERPLTILVATSGDTGGAIAAGFYDVPGVRVVILYPSGKISALQEKQIAALGGNIHALEIEGNFDDCQRLVKECFLDKSLRRRLDLSSANSINIARLLPQSFYYFEAYKHLLLRRQEVIFSVPSGNFGNLSAGLLAKRMGLPVAFFVAATNANDVAPRYLNSGVFVPRPSIPTISNAMDVGDPSNFARILDLHCSTWNDVKHSMRAYSFSDTECKNAILEVYNKYGYLMDPHSALGYLAAQKTESPQPKIVLATAHPAKFAETIEPIIGAPVYLPDALRVLQHRTHRSEKMPADYGILSEWLLNTVPTT